MDTHKWTDRKLNIMERYLKGLFSRTQDEVGAKWRAYFLQSGRELKSLQAEYDKAKENGAELDKIAEKLQREKKRATIYNKRFKAIMEKTALSLAHVSESALSYINGQLPEIFTVNYNDFAKHKISGYSFSLINPDTVANLVKRGAYLPRKKLNVKKDVQWTKKKMLSEVLLGILQGEPMADIAGRLSNVTAMSAESAIKNARTMVTGAECSGRQASFERAEADGVILEKYWIDTSDAKTRKWHREAGSDYRKSKSIPVKDFFIVNGERLLYPGDSRHGASGYNYYNCRCTVASKVVGFRKIT